MKFRVLFFPGLIGLMCLALFAQEPQGGGGQSAPGGAVGGGGDQSAPDGAAGARGGQRGARGGGPPRGGGPAFKNLQVLNPATLPDTMQSFVQALGLLEKGTCNYCHVEDRSSDEKRPKVIARRMVTDASNQRHLPGRPAARDLLHLPPRQHSAANGAGALASSRER
jgi:hypothetical protein